MTRLHTPPPEELETMEPEALQEAILAHIADLDRRSSISISREDLQDLETLLCAKLDRGLRLTVREQDILDHIENVQTRFFGAPRSRFWLMTSMVVLAALVLALVWVLWSW
jgi:hypothetical protein